MKRSIHKNASKNHCSFENLENRQHFSVYTVSNALDSGAGSLRAAIAAVNADSGTATDSINFAIGNRSAPDDRTEVRTPNDYACRDDRWQDAEFHGRESHHDHRLRTGIRRREQHREEPGDPGEER